MVPFDFLEVKHFAGIALFPADHCMILLDSDPGKGHDELLQEAASLLLG